MDEKTFAGELMAILLEGDLDVSDEINSDTIDTVLDYAQAGLLTRDAGLVVRMKDGSEFQLTIVRSREARG